MCSRRMRAQSEWNVEMVGRSVLVPTDSRGTNWATRSFISRAALLVYVTARMFAGETPCSMRCARRKVITRVLPVPAPARIKTGPRRVSTAWRCCGLSEPKSNIGREVYGSRGGIQDTIARCHQKGASIHHSRENSQAATTDEHGWTRIGGS